MYWLAVSVKPSTTTSKAGIVAVKVLMSPISGSAISSAVAALMSVPKLIRMALPISPVLAMPEITARIPSTLFSGVRSTTVAASSTVTV